MTGWGRSARVAAALTLGAVLASGAAAATAAPLNRPLPSTTVSDEGAQAFADVATCAATSDHLLAAIVVDQSGSLRQTDPERQRVGAITTALDSLAQLGASSEGALDVQATLATFGTKYEELVGWGEVTGTHEATLQSAATTQLPDRDSDNLTDYRAALRGAQAALTARAASLEGSSCKVVLWFTDGKLDVDGTGGGPLTEQAWNELCAPQGIVDALRGDDVVIVALALFRGQGGGAVTDVDRDRLLAVVEGSGASATCGTVPVPATSAGGAYLSAEEAGDVRRMFARAAALIAGATPGPSATCPDAVCVDGALRIAADEGVGGVRIVLERPATLAPPQLTAPDGTTVALTPGGSEVSGASVAVADRDGLLVADVQFPSGSTGGDWILTSDPTTASAVDVYYFWGVTLAADAPDGLIVGEVGRVLVTATHADGTGVDLDAYASADLEVRLSGGVLVETTATGSGWELEVDVPGSDVPPSIEIDITARAVSAPSGVALGPASAQLELTTSLPPSFPSITTTRLDLPQIDGVTPVTGTLRLVGSERGPTTACFDPARVQGPAEAGEIRVTTDTPCVDIPANGEVDVEVTVTPASRADGRIDGVLPVSLEGVDADDPIVVEVPLAATMVRPVDEATRWGLVALFTLCALLMAWVTAEVARRLGDTFTLSPHARVAAIPVVFDEQGIRRTDGAPALLDPVDDFRPFNVGESGRRPRFAAAGLRFGRSFPAFPLAGGHGWVAADDGAVVVAPSGAGERDDGSRASAPFPGSVGFTVKADGPVPASGEIPGRLVVIIDSGTGIAAVLPDRIDDISGAQWDAIAGRARAAGEHRAVATERGSKAGAPGTSSSAPSEPGSGVAANDSSWAEAASDGAGARPDEPVATWATDPETSGADSAPPPSTTDWFDGDRTTPASTPPPSSRKRLRRPRRDRAAAPDQPAPAPRPTGHDDTPPAPPSSTNFWD